MPPIKDSMKKIQPLNKGHIPKCPLSNTAGTLLIATI